MMQKPQAQRLATRQGQVTLRSFCTAAQILGYEFDREFGSHAQFKSLYTQKESLALDAAKPEANVVLALVDEKIIVGFGVLAHPDTGERWLQLGQGRMIEVRVIEVVRSRRSDHIAKAILALMLDYPGIESKIAFMVGYSWTWDLDGTGLKAQTYRQLLIRLFAAFGFQEFETNEPNICLKLENLFMGRVGQQVPAEVVEQFNWLRFGLTPEPESPSTEEIEALPKPSGLSLFQPLQYENLNYLGIYHDWKTDRWTCRAAHEWEADLDWRRYNHDFTREHPLTHDMVQLGHAQTLDLFRRHGLFDYFLQVVEQIKKRRHMAIECFWDPVCNLRVMHFLHSNTLGRTNVCHAMHSGGITYYPIDRQEASIIKEGLNLSRAMSFKNAGACLPFGGARITVQSQSLSVKDHATIGFLAYVIDRVGTVVGPDMGFAPELVDIMHREGYGYGITGGCDSPLGPPGAATAYGVYLALKEAAYLHYGSMNLAGKKIVVQGLGAVGYPLVEHYLCNEDALLFVADVASTPLAKLQARLPGQLQVIAPEQVLAFHGDILMPCAQGGIIDERVIASLSYGIIIGGANNTLAADTQQEEKRLAGLLQERGILFPVDWLHNTAGFIGGAEEYLHRQQEDRQRVMQHVERVCRDGVRANLKAAKENRLSPTEQAYRHYNGVIYR